MFRCSWKELVGIDCPSCGAQRSFIHLVSGEFKESFVDFPALIPFILTIILAILVIFKLTRIQPKWIARLFGLTAAVMFISWTIKLIQL